MARIAVRRITVSIPGDLVEALDKHVACGVATTRTDLIADAIAREVKRLEDEAIDAEIYALANDPAYLESDNALAKEFDTADRETWAALDELDGGYA